MEAPKGGGKGKEKGQSPPPPAASTAKPTAAPAPAVKLKVRQHMSQEAAPEQDAVCDAPGFVPPTFGDGMGVVERVEEIFRREPLVQKAGETPPAVASPRSPRGGETRSSVAGCNVAHGTNLAAALSALRNSCGQMISIERLEALGGLWRSGATPVAYLAGDDAN